ncbi:MAG: hypothetical protein LLG09_09260 [Negativicutes bacterium]|nr:hypothetical protein [Negativicutes bacterium]
MSKVIVVPCSGIGKVYGLMAREAALAVSGHLATANAETVCLAHIVTGDEEVTAKVCGKNCISIDGCAALCSFHSLEAAGGIVRGKFRSVDEMRNHRGANPGTGSDLTEEGWQISDELAAKVAARVEAIQQEAE